jgi:hypothetical protein
LSEALSDVLEGVVGTKRFAIRGYEFVDKTGWWNLLDPLPGQIPTLDYVQFITPPWKSVKSSFLMIVVLAIQQI